VVSIFKSAVAAKDGAFQYDALPPGRYEVNAYSDLDGIIATRPETEIDIDAGAVARIE
jgi:uncharacterized protein (DUF2141 family)